MTSNGASERTGDNGVIIAGAGCTGLALAQGLKKAGIPVTVFERRGEDDYLHGRDWNMGTHWGISDLKQLVPGSIYEKLDTLTVDPYISTPQEDFMCFLKGDTGEVVLKVPANKFYRLRRSRLRLALSEGVDVRYGYRLCNVEYSEDGNHVSAIFTNGSSKTARIIVGADGSRSAVRQRLLDFERAKQVNVPYVSSIVQSTFTRDEALFLRSFHPLYLGAIHPIGRFGFMGMQEVLDPEKPETWTFFFNNTWPQSLEEQEAQKDWTPKQRLQQHKDIAKDFCDPWRSGLAWVDDGKAERSISHFGMGIWDPRTPDHQWDNRNGRATLCGDAAHTMTVQRAQGLNHALRSARELCDAIKSFWGREQDQAEAIGQYEHVMKARAGEEVALTKSTTEVMHDWTKVLGGPLAMRGISRNDGGGNDQA